MQIVSLRHVLICPNDGLVITRNNDRRDEIIHLTQKNDSPHWVYGKPLIHLVHRISEEEVRHGGIIPEKWGDV